jgi:ABC-type multidrug transport system fused ATPase/permease subunit
MKKHWPKNGNIKFENVNIRYRPHLDLTLKNISFSINNNEKIGIVGRTGSGKSTLSLTLFRIIELEKGNIIIDGVDISKIGLKILRSNITIIPQEPILFKGSLRFNLDPLYKYTDNEIKNAIDEVGLFQLMRENGKNIQDELNLFIKENGNNLSLGEKQLICFARAILRKNKIIVFDEATASLDHKTEEFVSKKIEEIFKNNTLLIIAHRIETLNKCDKIIVIDSGEIKEFDTIENLLKIKNGYFLNLYSNLKK